MDQAIPSNLFLPSPGPKRLLTANLQLLLSGPSSHILQSQLRDIRNKSCNLELPHLSTQRTCVDNPDLAVG